jgi:hypothetical protein
MPFIFIKGKKFLTSKGRSFPQNKEEYLELNKSSFVKKITSKSFSSPFATNENSITDLQQFANGNQAATVRKDVGRRKATGL